MRFEVDTGLITKIKIDTLKNGGGTMKIISKFIFFIIYDFLNDIKGGYYNY